MSVHVMSWVLKHSPEDVGGRRLVLLVLADKADDDGTKAYPSVETIAREARMSERGVRYALRALEESGAVQRLGVHSYTGTHEYRVVMGQPLPPPGGKEQQVGGQGATEMVSQIAPEPSFNHPDPLSPSDSVVRDLFDYWVKTCGKAPASTKLTDDRRRRVLARLKDDYTPEQIKAGIDGAAAQPFVNEQGRVFDDLELICRSGSKLEDFIARATYTPQRPSIQDRRSEHDRLQDERRETALRVLSDQSDEEGRAA